MEKNALIPINARLIDETLFNTYKIRYKNTNKSEDIVWCRNYKRFCIMKDRFTSVVYYAEVPIKDVQEFVDKYYKKYHIRIRSSGGYYQNGYYWGRRLETARAWDTFEDAVEYILDNFDSFTEHEVVNEKQEIIDYFVIVRRDIEYSDYNYVRRVYDSDSAPYYVHISNARIYASRELALKAVEKIEPSHLCEVVPISSVR